MDGKAHELHHLPGWLPWCSGGGSSPEFGATAHKSSAAHPHGWTSFFPLKSQEILDLNGN